jgi:hypothetical protein
MNANKRTVLTILAAGLIALAAAEAARAEEKPTVPEKTTFKVYGGSCSRSWRLLGTYENANDALRAAQKFRGEDKIRRVEVTTGNGDGLLLGNPTSFSVYRQGARCGNWFLTTTVESRQKADELMKSGTTDLQPLALVLHYPPAPVR